MRVLIIRLAAQILRPLVAALKEKAAETPSPIDDAVVEMAESIINIISSGELEKVLKSV